MTNLSKNFTLAEMTHSDTAIARKISNVASPEIIRSLTALCVNVLEPIRAQFGRPVKVSSGYRCPVLNRAVGGSATSQHTLGQAADIKISGVADWDIVNFVIANLPFDQIILEYPDRNNIANGWVHVSFGPRTRRSILTAKKVRGKTTYLAGVHV